MKNASLVLVGSGIKAISHLNTETKAYIRGADKVLYLLNEPITSEWIRENNHSSESLDEIYFSHDQRSASYEAITRHILENLRQEKHICVVMYGHPCFFASSGLEAVKQAKDDGYDARILPAISAEDCLFADLMIDPASSGRQSYDTTDFLIYTRNFDTSSHLVLLQVNSIGALNHVKHHDNKENISFLVEYLTQYYPSNHKITLYAAAQYPGMKPKIRQIQLKDLSITEISSIEMLYIPPKGICTANQSVLKRLSLI